MINDTLRNTPVTSDSAKIVEDWRYQYAATLV